MPKQAGEKPVGTMTRWSQLMSDWGALTLYQRFESVVALALTVVIALVIVVAMAHLAFQVVTGLLLGGLDPLRQSIFQSVFGEVLTVLIALEFNHTLLFVVARQQSIIQTKVVLLIALLALARKVIVLDLAAADPGELVGLAALTLALGVVYWMMRERDDRAASKSAAG
ncbi:MAG: phosphate-starvation-inducible PsiE family protein [Usitatibacter sp.]